VSERKSIVIIPTFNEAENIIDIIKEVFLLKDNFSILVVDDNSPDGTAQLVKKEMQFNMQRLFLIEREKKLGIGPAYINGFKWAINNGYENIYEMDADFSHNPNDLSRMQVFLTQNGVDVVIGSRYKTGVNVVNWPIQRVLISYFASWYARMITGTPIMDLTSGFVGYKAKVLNQILNNGVKFKGYAFQIEMKFKAHNLKYNLYEIPIIFTDRVKGSSKLNLSIISEAIFGLITMKINQIFSNFFR
tara:strand:- start:1928 stop:2665 length:738 start_codon:yes stop_codon:yes gene_type:complete